MSENEPQNKLNNDGLAVRTQAVVDDTGKWYTLLTLQIGILSVSLAIPVGNEPTVASGIRKAILEGMKDTLRAQQEQESAKLQVVESKLHLPGKN